MLIVKYDNRIYAWELWRNQLNDITLHFIESDKTAEERTPDTYRDSIKTIIDELQETYPGVTAFDASQLDDKAELKTQMFTIANPISTLELGQQMYAICGDRIGQTEQDLISMVSDVMDENKDGVITEFEANNFKRRFGDFRDTVSLAKTVKFVFENMYDEHKCQLFPWFPGKLPIQFHNQLDTMLDTNHFFIRYTTTLTIEQAHFILLINIKDTLLKFPIKRRNDGAFEVDGFRRFQTMTHIFESFPEMVRILQLQFSNMQPMDVSDLHIIGKGEISKKR